MARGYGIIFLLGLGMVDCSSSSPGSTSSPLNQSGAGGSTQAGAGAHTHNIKLTHATITWNMSGCPAFSPVTLQGFQINGTVSLITGNGSNALFETTPPTTTLQVCVTGGDLVPYSVPYSNVTLVFDGPATSHFGTQAIHGVVRNVDFDHERR